MTAKIRARSYAVYYGKGPLSGLETFDMVILEPGGWTTPLLRQLQGQQVTTLAYLSVLEVPLWLHSRIHLEDNDYIHVEGKRWIKKPFDNWLARPDSRTWRLHLSNRLDQLYRQGWDGIFLDTLGDVEDEELGAIAGWLAPATAELIHYIRVRFSDRIMIANNGLWRVVPLVTSYIDGVCWEGDLTPEILKEPWSQAMIDFLGRSSTEHGWVNLMLSQILGASSDALKRLQRFYEEADRYGFLSYAAPGNYADAIRLKNGRVVAPKLTP